VLTIDASLAAIRAALDAPWQDPGERGEVTINTGLTYRLDDPVRIRVRRRGRRYDLSDDGNAVARAEKPTGWLDVCDRLVAVDGFNVNRRGILFVPAVEGRDIAMLTLRLAQTSRAVYLALLELGLESGR
jgi:hypothetical protein